MKRNRYPVLLLSALLILLGGFLPSIVAGRQDASVEEKIQFAQITDIQLEFSESDLSLRQTISILCTDPETVDIPAGLANLKQEYVESLAYNMAVQLKEKSIGFWTFEESGREYASDLHIAFCQPRLASSNLEEDLSNIFWYVEVADTHQNQVMRVTIDDRTGTICSLYYQDMNRNHDKTQMQSILYSFSYLFLEELGEEYFDYDCNNILKDAQASADNSYLASAIRWWAGDHEMRTTFFVNGSAFYTYHAVVSY